MSKHFYFLTTVFFISSIFVIESMGVNTTALLMVGFSFALSMCGIILNELYEQRYKGEAFQKKVKDRLEEICFELQIMRDCRFDQMDERNKEIKQKIEVLAKSTEVKEKHKQTSGKQVNES